MNPITEAFHQTESNFFSAMSINKVAYDNLTAFATGVPVSNLNPAIVNRVNDKFQINLDDCKSFYDSHKLPWTLIIPEYLSNNSLEHLLQSNDFNLNDEGVAMSLALEDIQPCTANTKLHIKAMENDLATWSIPLLHGFESVPAITDVYTRQHQIASNNSSNIYHLSGFIDDTVVCSLTLSTTEQQARLDDIATMPNYQKQGFATSLIHAALEKAMQLRIRNCYLEASSSGLSVYKRIGFKPIFKNHYYEKGLND
jgi:ribosomal protein S18 acetylase RimI-like enzyme